MKAKRQFGCGSGKGTDNMKMNFKENLEDLQWIQLSQCKKTMQEFMETVINVGVP